MSVGGTLTSAGESARRSVKWIDRVSLALAVPAGAVTVLMMLHVIVDVAGRSILGQPLPSTLEIVSYWWMVVAVFAGLGYALLRGDHVRATVVTDALSASWRRWADVLALALLGLFAAGVAVFGLFAAVEGAWIGQTVLSAVPVPVWPAMFAIPLGAGCLVLQCFSQIIGVFSVPGSSR
ncbi:hypothetical protein GCM10009836_43920 [Pseudonocardia ailaonensis]|uniref:Tripartite ATP-independent periplasmic transporters DctQ component domain-containing protein n=1 Tax=Pseudonocardia ailaonensis TaxID=367279 RepID=A0ABN2N9U6_9PSEU